jgi:hypothetical protein
MMPMLQMTLALRADAGRALFAESAKGAAPDDFCSMP